MHVHYDIGNLPEFRQAAVTVGSFDGVHQGHRKLIRQLRRLSGIIRGESVVITFDPHPRNIVDPQDKKVALLSSREEKIRLLEETGIDHLVFVPFTLDFAQLTADEYIEKFLVAHFRPRYILIGFNHRFGIHRQGDVRFLRWKADAFGYEVIQVTGTRLDGEPISSSRIRKELISNRIDLANRLLGRPYPLTGVVIQGDQVGRTIGFPTANLRLDDKDKLLPGDGIYAAYAHWQGQRFRAMLYIGHKPTLPQNSHRVTEVHLIDFHEQIYGEHLLVEMIAFVREDRQFSDTESLRQQILTDRKQILMVLEDHEALERQRPKELIQKTAVAILNFNGLSHLQRYLPGVLQAVRQAGAECHVIDNASSDGSVSWLHAQYPDLPVTELRRNWGFAGGYNKGLLHIEAEYYFILNSDVDLGPGVLESLAECLDKNPDIAVVQPKILDDREKTRFEYAGAAGGWIDMLGYPFCRGRVFNVTEEDTGQYDQPAEIFWASGAAFFVRSELFHQFGGFDPQFFAHLEEIDLCWRFKRAGYRIWAESSVHVHHLGGGTLAYDTPRKAYLNFRNSLITLLKNERPLDVIWKIPIRILLDYAAILLFLSQGKIQHVWSVLRAQLDFILTLPLSILKRRYHQEAVNKGRIKSRPKLKGQFNGSIVWEFFLNDRKSFREIIR